MADSNLYNQLSGLSVDYIVNKTILNSHRSNKNIHVSIKDRENWNSKQNSITINNKLNSEFIDFNNCKLKIKIYDNYYNLNINGNEYQNLDLESNVKYKNTNINSIIAGDNINIDLIEKNITINCSYPIKTVSDKYKGLEAGKNIVFEKNNNYLKINSFPLKSNNYTISNINFNENDFICYYDQLSQTMTVRKNYDVLFNNSRHFVDLNKVKLEYNGSTSNVLEYDENSNTLFITVPDSLIPEQADWNETDWTKLSYINNKPDFNTLEKNVTAISGTCSEFIHQFDLIKKDNNNNGIFTPEPTNKIYEYVVNSKTFTLPAISIDNLKDNTDKERIYCFKYLIRIDYAEDGVIFYKNKNITAASLMIEDGEILENKKTYVFDRIVRINSSNEKESDIAIYKYCF